MIDYVLLADFDIDKGSTLRIEHPSSPVSEANSSGMIADFMLPEGGHNFSVISTFFTLNRPSADSLQAI
jgi:hypothetical protein